VTPSISTRQSLKGLVERAVNDGVAAREAGRYREAVDRLSAAAAQVGAGPLRREARVALGRELGLAYLGLEQPREARHALMLALERSDGEQALEEPVRAALGALELMLGDVRAARRWLADRGRDRRATLLALARLRVLEGDHAEAEGALQSCEQAPGGSLGIAPASSALRSLVAIWEGRPDQARMLYDGVATQGNAYWELVRLAILRAVWVQTGDGRYLRLAVGAAEELRFGEGRGTWPPGFAAAAAAHHAVLLALTGDLSLALDAADTARAQLGDLCLPEWPRQAILHDLAVVYRDAGQTDRWHGLAEELGGLPAGPWPERMRRVTGPRADGARTPPRSSERGVTGTSGALMLAALGVLESRQSPLAALTLGLVEALGARGATWRSPSGATLARVGARDEGEGGADPVTIDLEHAGKLTVDGLGPDALCQIDRACLERLARAARQIAHEQEGVRSLRAAHELADAGRAAAEEALERARRPGSAPVLGGRFRTVVGRSEALRQLLDRLAALATVSTPVLLEGAAGSGRRHIGQAFAALGRDDAPPCPTLDLALVPPDAQVGTLERLRTRAGSGCYLIAHAEHLTPEACSWVVAAAAAGPGRPVFTLDRDAAGAIPETLRGTFAVGRALVPGLDERLEDLPMLLDAFLREAGRRPEDLSTAARSVMARRPFCGHVAEVRTLVHHAAVRADQGTIQPEHLEADAEAPALALSDSMELGYHDAVRSFRRDLLRHALGVTAGNRTQAAELLGLQRTYFMRLIRDLGAADA